METSTGENNGDISFGETKCLKCETYKGYYLNLKDKIFNSKALIDEFKLVKEKLKHLKQNLKEKEELLDRERNSLKANRLRIKYDDGALKSLQSQNTLLRKKNEDLEIKIGELSKLAEQLTSRIEQQENEFKEKLMTKDLEKSALKIENMELTRKLTAYQKKDPKFEKKMARTRKLKKSQPFNSSRNSGLVDLSALDLCEDLQVPGTEVPPEGSSTKDEETDLESLPEHSPKKSDSRNLKNTRNIEVQVGSKMADCGTMTEDLSQDFYPLYCKECHKSLGAKPIDEILNTMTSLSAKLTAIEAPEPSRELPLLMPPSSGRNSADATRGSTEFHQILPRQNGGRGTQHGAGKKIERKLVRIEKQLKGIKEKEKAGCCAHSGGDFQVSLLTTLLEKVLKKSPVKRKRRIFRGRIRKKAKRDSGIWEVDDTKSSRSSRRSKSPRKSRSLSRSSRNSRKSRSLSKSSKNSKKSRSLSRSSRKSCSTCCRRSTSRNRKSSISSSSWNQKDSRSSSPKRVSSRNGRRSRSSNSGNRKDSKSPISRNCMRSRSSSSRNHKNSRSSSLVTRKRSSSPSSNNSKNSRCSSPSSSSSIKEPSSKLCPSNSSEIRTRRSRKLSSEEPELMELFQEPGNSESEESVQKFKNHVSVVRNRPDPRRFSPDLITRVGSRNAQVPQEPKRRRTKVPKTTAQIQTQLLKKLRRLKTNKPPTSACSSSLVSSETCEVTKRKRIAHVPKEVSQPVKRRRTRSGVEKRTDYSGELLRNVVDPESGSEDKERFPVPVPEGSSQPSKVVMLRGVPVVKRKYTRRKVLEKKNAPGTVPKCSAVLGTIEVPGEIKDQESALEAGTGSKLRNLNGTEAVPLLESSSSRNFEVLRGVEKSLEDSEAKNERVDDNSGAEKSNLQSLGVLEDSEEENLTGKNLERESEGGKILGVIESISDENLVLENENDENLVLESSKAAPESKNEKILGVVESQNDEDSVLESSDDENLRLENSNEKILETQKNSSVKNPVLENSELKNSLLEPKNIKILGSSEPPGSKIPAPESPKIPVLESEVPPKCSIVGNLENFCSESPERIPDFPDSPDPEELKSSPNESSDSAELSLGLDIAENLENSDEESAGTTEQKMEVAEHSSEASEIEEDPKTPEEPAKFPEVPEKISEPPSVSSRFPATRMLPRMIEKPSKPFKPSALGRKVPNARKDPESIFTLRSGFRTLEPPQSNTRTLRNRTVSISPPGISSKIHRGSLAAKNTRDSSPKSSRTLKTDLKNLELEPKSSGPSEVDLQPLETSPKSPEASKSCSNSLENYSHRSGTLKLDSDRSGTSKVAFYPPELGQRSSRTSSTDSNPLEIDSRSSGTSKADSDPLELDSDRSGTSKIGSSLPRLDSNASKLYRTDSGLPKLSSDCPGTLKIDSDRSGNPNIDSDRSGTSKTNSDRSGTSKIDLDLQETPTVPPIEAPQRQRSIENLLHFYLLTKLPTPGPPSQKKTREVAILRSKSAEKLIKAELQRLLAAPEWNNELNASLLAALRNMDLLSVASATVEVLRERSELKEELSREYTPPAPPMTVSQQKIIGFLSKFEVLKPGTMEQVMYIIEYTLFRLRTNKEDEISVELIEELTRFHILIAKIKKDRERARIFLCDALYSLQHKAFNVLYVVMTSWAEVVPRFDASAMTFDSKVPGIGGTKNPESSNSGTFGQNSGTATQNRGTYNRNSGTSTKNRGTLGQNGGTLTHNVQNLPVDNSCANNQFQETSVQDGDPSVPPSGFYTESVRNRPQNERFQETLEPNDCGSNDDRETENRGTAGRNGGTSTQTGRNMPRDGATGQFQETWAQDPETRKKYLVIGIATSIMSHIVPFEKKNQTVPKEPQYLRIVPVKRLLMTLYGYPDAFPSLGMTENLLKAIKVKRENSCLVAAIVLIAKREGTEWAHKNVVEKLVKMATKDGGDNLYEIYRLLGYVLRPFPITDESKIVEKVVNKLCEILDAKTESPEVQEGIVLALLTLTRHYFVTIFTAVLRWQPSRPLNNELKLQLQNCFESRTQLYWNQFQNKKNPRVPGNQFKFPISQ